MTIELSEDTVEAALDRLGLHWFHNQGGEFFVYFLPSGSHPSLACTIRVRDESAGVHLQWMPGIAFDPARRPELLAVANDWNRSHHWPHIHVDGAMDSSVSFWASLTVPAAEGISSPQLAELIAVHSQACLQFWGSVGLQAPEAEADLMEGIEDLLREHSVDEGDEADDTAEQEAPGPNCDSAPPEDE